MLLQKATTLSIDSIDHFHNSLSARGHSKSTVKAYTSDLRTLLKEMETNEISMEEFQFAGMNWLTANRERVAAKTTGRRLTSLKAFARWSGWPRDELDEYIAPIPLKGQPHPIPEGIPGIRAMIAATDRHKYKALVAIPGMAGLRVAEALSVRPSHFELDAMMLKVYGKGKKMRRVPVSDECWSNISTAVLTAFVTGTDEPVVGLKDRHARSVISRLGEKAHLSRHVASHDLRATFATELYNRTLDQRLVQEILGHASMDQTSLYVGVAQEKMHAAVNKL